MNQKDKTKFRSSKEWKAFRKALKDEQKVDPLTLNKLTTRANCHHRDLNPEHYSNISDKSHFVVYNSMSHDTVHFLYNIARRCGLNELFNRLKGELEPMLRINNDTGRE